MSRGFTEAVETFIKSAEWLSDDDLVAVISLKAMAEELDEATKLNPPLVAQFGLTYRNLLKKKPTGHKEVDPLAELLSKRDSK
jgi:hypothetical protein